MTTKNWSTHEIIIMFVILVALLNSAVMTQVFYKTKQPLLFPILNTIFYIVILILLFQKDTLEGFFFEVSPTRKKCLMEQVSRKNFDKKMPCSCCQKGTVGGIPPNYAQWLGKSDSDTSGWFRPDHVQYVDTFSNGQECQSFKQPVYVEHV